MAEVDDLNLSTLDYRLNGFKVNRVMAVVRNHVENDVVKYIDECDAKKFF